MFWAIPLTIIVYIVTRKISLKFKNPILNPLIIAPLILIPILLLTGVSYKEYSVDVKLINDLLPYSVITLAYPLYQLLPQIKQQWKLILCMTLFASVFAMISGVFLAFWLGASPILAASVLPKSVTTAIAVTIAENQGGLPSIAALSVIFVGILGAVFGHQLMNLFKIKSPLARGIAMGAVSHAVGTARCIEVDYKEGAYSSLSLVLCGVITSLISPFIFPILLFFYSLF